MHILSCTGMDTELTYQTLLIDEMIWKVSNDTFILFYFILFYFILFHFILQRAVVIFRFRCASVHLLVRPLRGTFTYELSMSDIEINVISSRSLYIVARA